MGSIREFIESLDHTVVFSVVGAFELGKVCAGEVQDTTNDDLYDLAWENDDIPATHVWSVCYRIGQGEVRDATDDELEFIEENIDEIRVIADISGEYRFLYLNPFFSEDE